MIIADRDSERLHETPSKIDLGCHSVKDKMERLAR